VFFFFLPKIGLGGRKLLQLQNLGGSFVVFFRRRKLLLSLLRTTNFFYRKVYIEIFVLHGVCANRTKMAKNITDLSPTLHHVNVWGHFKEFSYIYPPKPNISIYTPILIFFWPLTSMGPRPSHSCVGIKCV